MPSGMRTTRAIAIGSLVLLAIAWGAIPLFVRVDVPPSHLVAMRVTLGAVVLVLFSVATKRFTIPRYRWKGVALLGAILAAHWLSFFMALNLTTVAVTLAILYIGPVLAAVLSGPVLHERVSRHAFVGLAVAVVGTLFVIRPGSGATVTGVAVAATSGVLLAAIMLLGKPLAADLGGVVVATWELVVASVLLAPFTVQAVRESGEYWPQFIVLGAVFTGLAGVVYWTSMRRLPVAVVSVIMYLEPASAVVWAALFLGEQPDPLTWLGVVLVVAAGTIATRGVPDEEAVGVAETL
ncbi:MAG: DMT family transporter [Actinomycetia bacterium]|nr:DMT family transporter [Actinomycetes bacterium]